MYFFDPSLHDWPLSVSPHGALPWGLILQSFLTWLIKRWTPVPLVPMGQAYRKPIGVRFRKQHFSANYLRLILIGKLLPNCRFWTNPNHCLKKSHDAIDFQSRWIHASFQSVLKETAARPPSQKASKKVVFCSYGVADIFWKKGMVFDFHRTSRGRTKGLLTN